MTLERTHALIVAHVEPGNGNSRNHCRNVYGEDFRELDLKKQWKLQHVSYNMALHLKVP